MAFDIGLLKKHPYATGAVVIVGGIVVFYLVSSGGNASAGTVSSDGGVAAADATLGQAQAAAAIQTNAQNAQIQQAQIAASTQNQQTDASVNVQDTSTLAALVAALGGNQTGLEVTQSNNDAATLQQQNQEVSNQNVEALQESGIQDQINEAYNINANNNSTSLQGLEDTLTEQGAIAQQTLGIAGTLAEDQQTAFDSQIPYIVQNAGDQKNSALDATDQTSIFQTILSGGNPGVAVAGTAASASTANSGNASTASIINSISKLGTSIGAGLFG